MQILKLRTAASLFFLSFLLALPGASQGHAFPDHSEPKVGATVSGSPSYVRIWFDGALESAFSTIIVQNAGGKRIDKGDGHVNSANAMLLEASLPQLPAGAYHVIWNVVSRDGHRTAGDYTFVIK
jgi:methionine-rich copper-binding protein CopC